MTPHPALVAGADAAAAAYAAARAEYGRADLIAKIEDGADGTPSSRIDLLADAAIIDAARGVNILSEEAGWIDRGAAVTMVIDPIDGTGNASAGVPFCAFTAAIAIDDVFTEALTHSLSDGRRWWAKVGEPTPLRTSGATTLDGALVSLIRPKQDPTGFMAVTRAVDRVRILGSSAIESAFVADGTLDAHVDARSRTHRIVDLAAAVVLVNAAGGVVLDAEDGAPVGFNPDIESRYSGVVAATPELGDAIVALLA